MEDEARSYKDLSFTKKESGKEFLSELQPCTNEEEIKSLCVQLKDVCIFNDGKGVERDPTTSANIIHKLGLVHFKQTCHRISLIKCVGLLNSAIERNPTNVTEIEKDLSKVCQHILEKANAQDQDVNLIEHAKYVKSQIESMRIKTNLALELIKHNPIYDDTNLKELQIDRINAIAKIQQRITEDYKKIMKDLCKYCANVMGPSPCKFAVVGMGSLARREITPFSDFEHIILTEIHENYKKNLEYFRWFSVVFHTIILNLRETIIPNLNIMYLNGNTCDWGDWFYDNHTSGVSFDGMMPHACKFPLGRTQPTKKKPWATELIKPVGEMLDYLSSEESLKNGYHLNDILTQTCYVFGDQSLHNEFKAGILDYQTSKARDEILADIRKEVKEDLDKFATRIRLANLKPNGVLNVKQLFYRTSTLFVGALGKIYNAKSLSCFDIINELAEQRTLSDNAKLKLSFAVAIACEIRLRIYMNAKSQRDYIQPCEKAETIFDEVLKFMDVSTIINYFQITYCLQQEVMQVLEIKESHIYSNSSLMNITICYALKRNELMLSLLNKFKPTKRSVVSAKDGAKTALSVVRHKSIFKDVYSLDNFDRCICNLEDEINFASLPATKQSSQANSKIIYDALFVVFKTLPSNENFSESVEFLERILEILQHPYMLSDGERKEISEAERMDMDVWICWIKTHTAENWIELNQFVKASQLLKEVVRSCEDQFHHGPTDDIILLYFEAGNIYYTLKEYEKSFNCLQLIIGITLSDTILENKQYVVTMSYSGIGACLLELNQHEESLL